MKKIIKYVCEHCGREYKKDYNCKSHEEICWKNKLNRTCLTCKFDGGIQSDSDDYGTSYWRVCLNKDCDECENYKDIEPVVDCEFWKEGKRE